jgi:hypothetical protein
MKLDLGCSACVLEAWLFFSLVVSEVKGAPYASLSHKALYTYALAVQDVQPLAGDTIVTLFNWLRDRLKHLQGAEKLCKLISLVNW